MPADKWQTNKSRAAALVECTLSISLGGKRVEAHWGLLSCSIHPVMGKINDINTERVGAPRSRRRIGLLESRSARKKVQQGVSCRREFSGGAGTHPRRWCCGAAAPHTARRRGTYCGWRSGLVVSSQEFGAASVDKPKVTFAASGCPSLERWR